MADLHATRRHAAEHLAGTLANPMLPPSGDLLRVGSRRWFLQTGLAGLAGVSLADSLRLSALGASQGGDRKAVVLFWLSGGPSHIDMWDPKPEAPQEIRGPYRAISTNVPGIRVCEHLPLQARIMDKLSIIRSVDCSASNHTPITMQAGNALARRTDDGNDGGGYPSMGSVAAKFRGPNDPAMPAFVGLADSWKADVWGAGHMGGPFEPLKGNELRGRLAMPEGINVARLQNRHELRQQFDRMVRGLDRNTGLAGADRYTQMAYDMVVSGQVQRAFDVSQEPEAMRDAYGRAEHRRKGAAGPAAGRGRRHVRAGQRGLGLLRSSRRRSALGRHRKGVDADFAARRSRALYALVNDLADRGLLDSTLVLMMGEFGRSPVMTKTAGREHWTNVMSMVVAGGGLPSGQVIGSTDDKGYGVKEGRVTPADLAATTFRHLGIDLEAQWTNPQGRPIPIVTEGGRPIPGLQRHNLS